MHVTSCPVTVKSGVGVWPPKHQIPEKKIPELDLSSAGHWLTVKQGAKPRVGAAPHRCCQSMATSV